MKVQTFSIVCGTAACNAQCPFCVSRMTGTVAINGKIEEPNWRNLMIACQLARASQVTDVILTGTGEPTIHPDYITAILGYLANQGLGIIQMQTNALLLGQRWDLYEKHLRRWYELGLSTIAISTVHYDPEVNRQVYLPHKKQYIDLPKLIGRLHQIGYTVRIVCTLVKGWVDSAEAVRAEIEAVRGWQGDQLTLRPVTLSYTPAHAPEVYAWTKAHLVAKAAVRRIRDDLTARSSLAKPFGDYGAMWYDIGGMNVVLSNCLTVSRQADQERQLIFYGDGTITTDWQFPGTVILAGRHYHQEQG